MNPFPMGLVLQLSLKFRAAVRLAAAALTGCQGGRCVWTHDFAPAVDTACCDVDCRVVVGVPNEATPATLKFALGATVTFVDPTAAMTRLRGVGGVDLDERGRQQYPADVRNYLWGNHFWTPSYFAASCGGAPLTVIKQYIEQQNRPD
jgi:hypothetical protein